MIGMLQLLTYLFCIYLLFKGFEIFQIAYVSSRDKETRDRGILFGLISLIVAIAAAVAFSILVTQQAESISSTVLSPASSISSEPSTSALTEMLDSSERQREMTKWTALWSGEGEENYEGVNLIQEIIKEKCSGEWPDDYQMQAHCTERQREATLKIGEGKPSDISESEFEGALQKCVNEWINDFAMTAHCLQRQYDGIRTLR